MGHPEERGSASVVSLLGGLDSALAALMRAASPPRFGGAPRSASPPEESCRPVCFLGGLMVTVSCRLAGWMVTPHATKATPRGMTADREASHRAPSKRGAVSPPPWPH